jgi:hypothetical protein
MRSTNVPCLGSEPLPTSIGYIQKYDEMSSILKYCTVEESVSQPGSEDDGLGLLEAEKLLNSCGKNPTLAHFMLIPALHAVKNWDSSLLKGLTALMALAR